MTKDVNLLACESDASGLKGKALSVFYPENVEDVRKLVAGGSHFAIRGAGTGLAGGCVPQNEQVIDLSKMGKILNFDLKNNIVEVEAGVMLDELNEFLSGYGLEFPVKPGSHSSCSIGGMIAVNAAGERAVKYGKTGKWVESLEVVDAKGEILKIKKYNLNDFIGMEGITGIIVKARLKVVEKKERTASLLSFDSIDEVIENTEKYLTLPEVSEIEFLDKLTSSLINLPEKYHLLIEFESEQGELKTGAYKEIMKKRDGVYPALASAGFVKIEDPKIQINRFKDFSNLIESLKIPYYGHLGLGIIHPVFKLGEEDKIQRVLNFVKKIKGMVSGEHGIGISKKEFLEDSDKKIIIIVKKRYDPMNKFNQGKFVDLADIKLSSSQERRLEELEKIEKVIEQQNSKANSEELGGEK